MVFKFCPYQLIIIEQMARFFAKMISVRRGADTRQNGESGGDEIFLAKYSRRQKEYFNSEIPFRTRTPPAEPIIRHVFGVLYAKQDWHFLCL